MVQATILPRVNPASLSPDLVLIMLFLWSASRGVRESLAWLFFTGLLLDVLSLDPLGTNGLALVVLVLLSGPGRRRIFQFNVLVPVLLVFVATVVHAVVLSALRGAPMELAILWQAGLNALFLPVLYLIARLFDR